MLHALPLCEHAAHKGHTHAHAQLERDCIGGWFGMARNPALHLLHAGCINLGARNIHPWGWRLPLAIAGEAACLCILLCLTLKPVYRDTVIRLPGSGGPN